MDVEAARIRDVRICSIDAPGVHALQRIGETLSESIRRQGSNVARRCQHALVAQIGHEVFALQRLEERAMACDAEQPRLQENGPSHLWLCWQRTS